MGVLTWVLQPLNTNNIILRCVIEQMHKDISTQVGVILYGFVLSSQPLLLLSAADQTVLCAGGTTGGLSDVRGDDRPGTGIMDQLKGLVDFGGNTGGVKDITGGTTGGVADITGGNSGDTSDVQGTKKPGDAWLVPPTSGRGDDEDTQT